MSLRFGMARKVGILAFALVAVSATMIGLFSYHSFRDLLVKQMILMQGDEVKIEAARTEKELDELKGDLLFVSRTPPIDGVVRSFAGAGIDPLDGSSQAQWLARLAQIFEQLLVTSGNYHQIKFIRTEGRQEILLDVSNHSGDTVVTYGGEIGAQDRKHIEGASMLPAGEIYVSRIMLSSENNTGTAAGIPLLKAVVPVFDADKRVFGVLMMSLDLRGIFDLLDKHTANQPHLHYITDENGNLIHHGDPAHRFAQQAGASGRLQDMYPEFKEVFASGVNVDAGHLVSRHEQKKVVMMYKKIRLDAGDESKFIVSVDAKPYDVVLAQINKIRDTAGLLIIILIAIAGTIAMTTMRAQLRPLAALKDAIQNFSSAGISVDLPVRRDDELGVLAKAFNAMTSQVADRDRELRQSEERFRQFAEHINDVFWITNPDASQILYLSPAYEQIWGIKPEVLYADPTAWHSTIHPDDWDRVIGPYLEKELLEDNEEEFRIIATDGRVKWVNNRAFVVKGADGKVSRILGVAKDITAAKEAEARLNLQYQELKLINQKLQEAQNQLLQSEKMASVGQLAAGVAHEINNPAGYVNSNIGSLKVYIDELLRLLAQYEKHEALLPAEALSLIDSIKREIDIEYLKQDVADLITESLEGLGRLKMIVQDLKDFSRVDEAEWQWADLHKGINSTLNIVHNELKYRAEVVKQYGELPEVECIASQINQVIMNLLVNAAHALETRGTITIRTGVRGERVWISVSDTGKGIAKEHLHRIFDPFFTTKPVGKGTGLGLSLSYSIIERHAGSIDVESEVGKGTTFTITMPIRQAQPKAEC